jgi:hypothetical protein
MQAVSLEHIYTRCIGMWPMNVGIGDGRQTPGDGYLFPELSRVHAEIEAKVEHASDHWGAVFTWAMFQAAHEYARVAVKLGESHLTFRRVPLALIDTYIRKSLAEPEWQAERLQYVGVLDVVPSGG